MTKGKSHQAGKSRAMGTKQWAKKVIAITENEKQGGIEIKFDAEPSPQLQPKLRAMSFRHSRTKTMWYGDNSQQAIDFAEQVKATLPDQQDGPDLLLKPSAETVKSNLEKKEFSFVMITLNDKQVKNYIVFEPSKPRAEVIATNFARDKFGDQFLTLAVLPKNRIKEARILFDEGKVIEPDESDNTPEPLKPDTKETMSSNKSSENNDMENTPIHAGTQQKIKLKRIELTTIQYDGIPDYAQGIFCQTWQCADKDLIEHLIGKQTQLYFRISWEDNNVFQGRMNVESDGPFAGNTNPFSWFAKDYLTFLSNQLPSARHSKKQIADAENILKQYALEDVPEPELTGKKTAVQTILLTTEAESRQPDFSVGAEVTTWKEANAYVRSKIGQYSDVYYEVIWEGGDHFEGWVDIEPPSFYEGNNMPLSNHIKGYLTNYSKVKEGQVDYDKESTEYAQHLLDNCLFEDVSEPAFIQEKTGEHTGVSETQRILQIRLEREALDKYYKWAVKQDNKSMKPSEITREQMAAWFNEHEPALDEKTIASIWESHKRILKSLNRIKTRSSSAAISQPYSSIYKKLLQVIPGLPDHIKAGKLHGKSRKDPEGGLMDLNYDFVANDKNGDPIIALSHYFKQQGDMVADPDMQIRLYPDRQLAEAMTYQDQFVYQEVYPEKDGKQYVNLKLKKQLNTFLNQWLSNIIRQGHKIDLSQEKEQEEPNYYRNAWDLLLRLVPMLNEPIAENMQGGVSLPAGGRSKAREIACTLTIRNGSGYEINLIDSENKKDSVHFAADVNPETHTAIVNYEWFREGTAKAYGREESQKRILQRDGDLSQEMTKGLISWLEETARFDITLSLERVVNPGYERRAEMNTQQSELWNLIHKLITGLRLPTGEEQHGELVLVDVPKGRHITAAIKPRGGQPQEFSLKLTDTIGEVEMLRSEVVLRANEQRASVISIQLLGDYAKQSFQQADVRARLGQEANDAKDMNEELLQWLRECAADNLYFSVFPVGATQADPAEKEAVPVAAHNSGNPVFDAKIMAMFIASQSYLTNAWGLSYAKETLKKKTFSAEETINLQSFYAIYVEEDSPMREAYLEAYRKEYTIALDLTYQKTDTLVPNVLVPSTTKEPFHSHDWKKWDMPAYLKNSFPGLLQIDDSNLKNASPIQLYELMQMGQPEFYGISVSQDNLIEIWKTRGQEIYDMLGLPTNIYYPYADLIAGYENIMSLRDVLKEGNEAGDEWWVVAALYRPIANVPKALAILDDLIQKAENERREYLGKGDRPKSKYKRLAEKVELLLRNLEESRAAVDFYLKSLNPGVKPKDLLRKEDSLLDTNGIYSDASAGDHLERLKIPMPPEAKYELEISIVKTGRGFKIGLSASKDFGSSVYQGLFPRQTNTTYLSREDALAGALNIHVAWLNEILNTKEKNPDDTKENQERTTLALQALENFAQENGIKLVELSPEHRTVPEQVTEDELNTTEKPDAIRDPLTNENGVYTKKTAGKNLEELIIPMPKSAQYQAEIAIAKTSAGTYKWGIHAYKGFGDAQSVGFSPGVTDADFATRYTALKAALTEHKKRLEELIASKDTILNNEAKKNKQLGLALEALLKYAHENDVQFGSSNQRSSKDQPEKRQHGVRLIGTPATDPLADEDGFYTNFSAGNNFEELEIPMPKGSGYEAAVYLVKTSAGNYKEGIRQSKKFGDQSYFSEFPTVRDEAYPNRRAALKAALLAHEQQLQILLGRKDTILNNEASKKKKLALALTALIAFAKVNGTSLNAVPDNDPEPEGFVPELEAAYWKDTDNQIPANRIEVNGTTFDQARLRALISEKLMQLPLSTLEQIAEELSQEFQERRPLADYLKDPKTATKNGDQRKATLIVFYIDDIIIDNDLGEDSSAPVMSFLVDMLFSASPRLVDLPQNKTEKEITRPVKKQSQHSLNKEIEAFIDEKDKTGAYFNEEEKNFLRQYTGSGGLITEGATGRGTLYEYYTPDAVIRKMWDMAYHYGYNGGRVLEPAVGTGNFLKYAPKNAIVFGFETNHYAARIAQVLYPNAHIFEKAFETNFFAGNIHLKDNFENPRYSLVIGNPPYGAFTGKYAGLGEKQFTGVTEYDQYFTLRSLDLLDENGLLVFLIPSYFMLSKEKYNAVKEKISAKAELVDCYRFPEGIIPKTDVGTDILILRKRSGK